jgi:hypothetical protein
METGDSLLRIKILRFFFCLIIWNEDVVSVATASPLPPPAKAAH